MVSYKIGRVTKEFSKILYVSLTGSDTSGDGSESSPYQTINKAMTILNSNATDKKEGAIILEDGLHNMTTVFSGASSNVSSTYNGIVVSIIAKNLGKASIYSTKGLELMIIENNSSYRIKLSFYRVVFEKITGGNVHLVGDDQNNEFHNCVFKSMSIGGYNGAVSTAKALFNQCSFINCTANSYASSSPISGEVINCASTSASFPDYSTKMIKSGNVLNAAIDPNTFIISAISSEVGSLFGDYADSFNSLILLKEKDRIIHFNTKKEKKTVNMTGNTTPAPFVISSSSNYTSSYPAYYALNGVNSGSVYWASSGADKNTCWLQIDMGVKTKVSSFRMSAIRSAYINESPKDFYLSGSDDGVTWDELGRYQVTDWIEYQMRSFVLLKEGNYRYYRLFITSNNGGVNATSVNHIELWHDGDITELSFLSDEIIENLINIGTSEVDVSSVFQNKKYMIDKSSSSPLVLNHKPKSIKLEES